MSSQAHFSFALNADDVTRLLEIHGEIGGTGPGKRYGLEVLNKSAVVLITSIWEAYCEDLAAEALDSILNTIPDASSLPMELRKRIAMDLKKESHDLAMWTLADKGWKAVADKRLKELTEERNRRLNTPKSENIDQLFFEAIGIAKLSSGWSWPGMGTTSARRKLDEFVALRGAIAHRGRASVSIKKTQVIEYFGHIHQLVDVTDKRVKKFVRDATSSDPW